MPRSHSIAVNDTTDTFLEGVRGSQTKEEYIASIIETEADADLSRTYAAWFRDLDLAAQKALYDANQ